MLLNHLNAFYFFEVKNSSSNLEHCGNFCFTPLRYLFYGRKITQIDATFIFTQKNKKEALFITTIKIILSLIFLLQSILLGTCIKAVSMIDKKVRIQHSLLCSCLNKKKRKKILLNHENNKFEILFNEDVVTFDKIFIHLKKKLYNITSIYFENCSLLAIKKFLLHPLNHFQVNKILFQKCTLKDSLLNKINLTYFPNSKLSCYQCEIQASHKLWRRGDPHLKLQDDSISDEEILAITKKKFTISHLTLQNCSHLSDLSIEAIAAKTSKNLKIITIINCPNITLESISNLIKKSKLESLNIENFKNNDIDEYSLQDKFFHTLKELSTLKNLYIGNSNFRLYKRHLLQVKALIMLETLNLKNLFIVNTISLNDTLNSLKLLKNLNLKKCIVVNSSTLETLFTHCKHLTYLDIRKCSLITKEDVNYFYNQCRASEEHHPIKNIMIDY